MIKDYEAAFSTKKSQPFEDWHKLYITAALTSVRLKESA
jgi:hypothetical protein